MGAHKTNPIAQLDLRPGEMPLEAMNIEGLPPVAARPVGSHKIQMRIDVEAKTLAFDMVLNCIRLSPIDGASEIIPITLAELGVIPFADVQAKFDAVLEARAAAKLAAQEAPAQG